MTRGYIAQLAKPGATSSDSNSVRSLRLLTWSSMSQCPASFALICIYSVHILHHLLIPSRRRGFDRITRISPTSAHHHDRHTQTPSQSPPCDYSPDRLAGSLTLFHTDIKHQFSRIEIIHRSVITSGLNELHDGQHQRTKLITRGDGQPIDIPFASREYHPCPFRIMVSSSHQSNRLKV